MARISELINNMVQRILESAEWTSANPTHINRLIQVNAVENPDFEGEIEKLLTDGTSNKEKVQRQEKENKKDKIIDDTQTKLDQLVKGNVGKVKQMSSEQFGNIQGIASNPIGFIIGKLGTKFVKGGVILGLVLLIEQIVNFAISEAMKPGRWLDRRLKIEIEDQVLSFTRRSELAELRQGFRSIWVTASPFMRGTNANVSGNLLYQDGNIQKSFQQEPRVKSNVGTYTTQNMPGQSRR